MALSNLGYLNLLKSMNVELNHHFASDKSTLYSRILLTLSDQSFNMWYYMKLFLLFLACCFFLLPMLNIEDPLRTISLYLWGKETDAMIVEHICKPDRTYWYEYTTNGKVFRQRYDGYVERLDKQIPEDSRCKGILSSGTPIKIKFFPLYSFWSEPIEHIEISGMEKLMYILIKILGIWILLFTFLRRT